MKPLNDYIIEKLKLSDIKTIRPQWVDADKLKIEDLQEGYIVELRNKRRYVVVPKIFVHPRHTVYQRVERDYILTSGRATNRLEDYANQFPKVKPSYRNEWDIVRIYTRRRHYNNNDEVKEDTEKLYHF